jgi:hypothetical protein
MLGENSRLYFSRKSFDNSERNHRSLDREWREVFKELMF